MRSVKNLALSCAREEMNSRRRTEAHFHHPDDIMKLLLEVSEAWVRCMRAYMLSQCCFMTAMPVVVV